MLNSIKQSFFCSTQLFTTIRTSCFICLRYLTKTNSNYRKYLAIVYDRCASCCVSAYAQPIKWSVWLESAHRKNNKQKKTTLHTSINTARAQVFDFATRTAQKQNATQRERSYTNIERRRAHASQKISLSNSSGARRRQQCRFFGAAQSNAQCGDILGLIIARARAISPTSISVVAASWRRRPRCCEFLQFMTLNGGGRRVAAAQTEIDAGTRTGLRVEVARCAISNCKRARALVIPRIL